MKMCLLWRSMRKPAFSSAFTARRCLTPGSFGISRGGHFHLADFAMQIRHAVEFKVALNGVADVFHGLGHRRPLGMAARQFGTTDGHALRMFEQRDVEFVFHLAGRLCPRAGFVNAECADFILHSAFLILPSPHGTGSSSKIFWMTVRWFFPRPRLRRCQNSFRPFLFGDVFYVVESFKIVVLRP